MPMSVKLLPLDEVEMDITGNLSYMFSSANAGMSAFGLEADATSFSRDEA